MKLPWRRGFNKGTNYQYDNTESDFITCARSSLDAARMDEPEITHLATEMRTLRLRNHFTQLLRGTPEKQSSDYIQ